VVVRVLERARDRVVGRFEIHDGPRDRGAIRPEARRGRPDRRRQDEARREGEIVEARLTSFPDARRVAHGEVEERLGFLGEPGVDIEIVLRSHGLPPRFPEPVIEESEKFPQEVQDDDLLGRRDFRDRRIVTIDGETARDFDDAVEVERRGEGFRLGVHIADVSHYVVEGSILDDEARSRGDLRVLPRPRACRCCPERLSNGLCSLNPASTGWCSRRSSRSTPRAG
jgi:ribonuclease R